MQLNGVVVKVTGRWYWVETPDQHKIRCAVKGSFRLKGQKSTNPVAVGDKVTVSYDSRNDTGLIIDLSDRKNYIVRKSSNLSHSTQVLAANIDQALLVASLVNPKTYTEFIDRFLVSAEAYRIPAVVVFNKTDLYGPEERKQLMALTETYTQVGYTVLHTSVPEDINLDKLRNLLVGKISLVAGNSGVGKSTLINKIEPGLNLKTRTISKYHRSGQHTTTYSEMFRISPKGYVIDTPGIKGFGLAEIDKSELYHFFPEIFRESGHCSYYNCTHTHEPDCAVKEAVVRGKISETRYNSYLNLFFEENKKYRE